MNLSKATQPLQNLERQFTDGPSNYSIIKRLFNLVLVVIGAVICINLWLAHTKQADVWYQQQANQLGSSLGKLAAQLLAQPLSQQDKPAISQQLHYLSDDPYVSGVALYNQKGQLLEEHDANLTIVARYQIDPAIPLVFIQDIHNQQGELIGYLRMILDEHKVMQYHFDYQQQMYQQAEVLMALAAVLGMILARAFYTFRYRQYRIKK